MQRWEYISTVVNDLCYYGNISYDSVMNMSPHDRSFQYDLLCDKKKKEHENYSK